VGLEYISKRKYNQGKKYIEKFLSEYPKDPQANMALGLCYEALGKYTQAIHKYKKSIKQFNQEKYEDAQIKSTIYALDVAIKILKKYCK
jgi:tetratricopeptide (TPR) repeat protein